MGGSGKEVNHARFEQPWQFIQTARWHPTPELASWVVSSTRSGLVRVENAVAGYDKIRTKAMKLAAKNKQLTVKHK
jgi:hypothetical protein